MFEKNPDQILNPSLEALFQKAMFMEEDQSSSLLKELIDIINQANPKLIDFLSYDFPLFDENAKWYEKHPEWWIVVNCLPYLDKPAFEKATGALKKQLF